MLSPSLARSVLFMKFRLRDIFYFPLGGLCHGFSTFSAGATLHALLTMGPVGRGS